VSILKRGELDMTQRTNYNLERGEVAMSLRSIDILERGF